MTDNTPKTSETKQVCPTASNPITKEVRSLIKAIACQTIRFSSFRKTDIEDLCQIYSMAVVNAFPRYDDSKQDYLTYVRGVIYRTKKNLYRTRIRKGKDSVEVSLDSIPPNDPCFIDDKNLPPDEALMRKERIEQINRVFEDLEPLQKKVCSLLMQNKKYSDVIRDLGLSESQFFHRILPEIQEKFKKIRRNR